MNLQLTSTDHIVEKRKRMRVLVFFSEYYLLCSYIFFILKDKFVNIVLMFVTKASNFIISMFVTQAYNYIIFEIVCCETFLQKKQAIDIIHVYQLSRVKRGIVAYVNVKTGLSLLLCIVTNQFLTKDWKCSLTGFTLDYLYVYCRNCTAKILNFTLYSHLFMMMLDLPI